MRRVLSPILVACGLAGLSLGLVGVSLGLGPAPAFAAGKKVCTITDDRLVEISGMIATESGYVVINDGSDTESGERVFFLDGKCKVRDEVRYSGNGPRDPEDLALSADGKTLWIADTGDNVTSAERRTSVVLWSLPVDGSARPVLHRLTYPGGKPHDAEALLLGEDGTPYIITKSTGTAEIYRPTAALRKDNAQGVPMEKAGEITLPKTTTANTFGPTGRVTITGAARSPDGTRIALRTYADAFEWDVVDSDIVKTLTTGEPRITALADPFGEAIAYTPDGKTFLTVSDVGSLDAGTPVEILSYPPTRQAAAPAGAEKKKAEAGGSWVDGLTLDDITYLIAAVGVLGALLVGAGVFGILRARRRPPRDAAGMPDADGDNIGPRVGRQAVPTRSADAPVQPARGTTYGRDEVDRQQPRGYEPAVRRTGGGVYGGKPGGSSGGGVYGAAPPAHAPSESRVYGGAGASSGGVYGGGGGGSGGGYRGAEGANSGDGHQYDGRPGDDRDGGPHGGAWSGQRNHPDSGYGYR